MIRARYVWAFFLILFAANVHYAMCMTAEDEARFGLAESLNNTGKYLEARPILEELKTKYPGDKNITFELAKAFGYGGLLKDAAGLFNELIERYPGDEEIERTYISILESNQAFAEVKKRYETRLKKDPERTEYMEKLGDVSSWSGDHGSAIKYYKMVIDRGKGTDEIKLKLADVFFWAGANKEAAGMYEEIGITPQTDAKRYGNLGDIYFSLNELDKAAAVYSKLVERDSRDISARMKRADVLFALGRTEEAELEIKAVVKERPDDTKMLMTLTEVLALGGRYDEAIKPLDEILAIEPDNKTALLYKARFLSWNTRYPAALEVYDRLIEKYPEWILPRREKGRVLGWARRYKDSIDTYNGILGEIGPDGPSELESKAKECFYKGYDSRAIESYKELLELEPENLEALFDIGQVYSRQMRWENARNTYNKVLKILPRHFRAKEALDKVDIMAKGLKAEAGYEFFEAGSASREVDNRYHKSYFDTVLPIHEGLYLQTGEETFFYSPDDYPGLTREKIYIGTKYYMKPFLEMGGGYKYNAYTEGVEDSHDFYGDINIRPIDPVSAGFYYARDDVADNSETFRRKLERDDYRLRADLLFNRRASFGADYVHSEYTDDNSRDGYAFDAKGTLSYEPRSLTVFYRYEEYGFGEERDYYFTPDSFHTNLLGAAWRHYLNKEELFWGGKDTYYTLKYTMNMDVKDQRGHKIFVEFHKDWTDRVSIHIEWSKHMYEHREIYGDEELKAYIKYCF